MACPGYMYHPNLLEMKLRALSEDIKDREILSRLDNVKWRVYRTFDFEGQLKEYVPWDAFISRLGGVNSYKEFQTLPYSLKVIRDNFGFLTRDKATIPGEINNYVDKVTKEFILGAHIELDEISSIQGFHTDDEFGANDVFIWYDTNGVYKGRPYNMPEKLGLLPPDLKQRLETLHKVIADFITKDLA